jgi:hypothetical protein
LFQCDAFGDCHSWNLNWFAENSVLSGLETPWTENPGSRHKSRKTSRRRETNNLQIGIGGLFLEHCSLISFFLEQLQPSGTRSIEHAPNAKLFWVREMGCEQYQYSQWDDRD